MIVLEPLYAIKFNSINQGRFKAIRVENPLYIINQLVHDLWNLFENKFEWSKFKIIIRCIQDQKLEIALVQTVNSIIYFNSTLWCESFF